jgi:hypothetical protein
VSDVVQVCRGGPLDDERVSGVHSLVVHMRGDGRSSIGAYVRVYDGDRPTDAFEWHPEPSWDEPLL